MEQHLIEHPADYQTVISYLKARSDVIDKQMKQGVNDRLKQIAYFRKELQKQDEANNE